MRLLKLEITGFKSFQNKTTLFFPRGITAVVGPNGCGKSNIVDALRWVMGEQSVKQLRGKSMEDLIFSGADGKQPLNMAEVSLLVDNSMNADKEGDSSGSPMSVYTEIMVTRRVYRSGESVYMINRQACRLKDIHNLFLGSGTGKNSFAVIGQGNIGALTDASPEERRYFIEDAADITKYKERKKETLARIKTTRENLTRISDIMSELKRRLGTLERQAARAKKYKEYKTRVKTLEISIALWYFENISRDIREKTAAYERTADTDKKLDTAIADLEIIQDRIKLRLYEKKQTFSDLTQNTFDIQRSLDKKESDLEHLTREIRRIIKEIKDVRKKRLEVTEKNSALTREIEIERNTHVDVDDLIIAREKEIAGENDQLDAGKNQLKTLEQTRKEMNQAHMVLAGDEAKYANILANAEQRKTALMRRLRQVDDELLLSEKDLAQARLIKENIEKESKEIHIKTSGLSAEKNETVQHLKASKDERDRLRLSLKSLEIELSAHQSRHTTLKAMNDQFEWYGSGVQSLMNRMKKNGSTLVKGVLADKIQPANGYEKAVEALLGDVLQYLVVDSPDHAEDLIRDLAVHSDGQCGFITCDTMEPPPEAETPPGLTPLLSQVSYQPEDRDLVRFILNNAMVADDLAQALHIRKTIKPAFPLVTRNGERVTERGIIIGGGSQNGSSIFAKKAELAETQAAVLEWEEKKSQLSIRVQAAESLVSEWTLKENHVTELLVASEKEKIRVEKELYMSGEALRQAERKHDVLSLEQERLEGDGEDIDTDLEREKASLENIRNTIRTHEARIKDLGEQIHSASETLEKQGAAIVELKMNLTRLKAESDNHHNSLKRLEDFLSEGKKRLARLAQEETEKKHLTLSHSTTRNLHRSENHDLTRRLKLLMEESELCRRDVAGIEKNLKERETEKTSLEKLKNKERESLRVLDLELSQLKIRRENLTARIEEKYHHQINQYKLEFAENEHDRIDVSTLNIPFLETELEDLNTRIAQLGDVNLGSIAEYDEIKERYDFMESQGKDLERSLADLETIIEKINDVSKERFLQTFDAINEKLATLFPTLFEGGSARMILTDPSIPLETGVELMIQPPGKKLTRLSLLSGGEKALSAIAFVFSIFLIKPASFCIMDEIDAPLDDANVTRFNNLVKHIGDQSQILVITHNKVTMEFADILFGVTMEKKGVSKIVSVSLTESGDIEPGSAPVPASADSV